MKKIIKMLLKGFQELRNVLFRGELWNSSFTFTNK